MIVAVLLAALLTLLGDAGPGTLAPEPWEPEPPSGIGVGIPWQLIQEPGQLEATLDVLQPPVWYDWTYQHIGQPGYLPMLWRVKVGAGEPGSISNWHDAVAAAQAHPGQLWLLGNEPEFAQQSNTEPDVFAESMREWQRLTDNPVACCGVYVSTYVTWMPWMYWYLHYDGPIPDYWHIHIYAGTPGMWERSYREFVWWMEINDIVRPVIVSETSAVQYPPWMHVWVLSEMPRFLEELEHLEAIMWYASEHMDDGPFSRGNLLNPDYTLTEVGHAWVEAQQVVGAEVYVMYLPSMAGAQ